MKIIVDAIKFPFILTLMLAAISVVAHTAFSNNLLKYKIVETNIACTVKSDLQVDNSSLYYDMNCGSETVQFSEKSLVMKIVNNKSQTLICDKNALNQYVNCKL